MRADRIRKSVGAESTFPTDLFTYQAEEAALREIIDKVWEHCERSGSRGHTVTLKVLRASVRRATPATCSLGNDPYRRILPVPLHPNEGPRAEPTVDAPARRSELVKMPKTGH